MLNDRTDRIQSGIRYLDGVDVTLTEEEVKYLEEPYKPQAIRGHV